MNREQRKNAVIQAMLCMQRWPWEQGVASQALIAIGEHALAISMAHDAVVNQHKDGRLAMKNDRYAALDPAANGEAVLLAYRETQEPQYRIAADKMLDYLLHRACASSKGVLFHNVNEGQLWIDAAFMVAPFLVMTGHAEKALGQLQGLRDVLFDACTGLYSHIYDCDLNAFVRKAFWGVGNGWMLAACARVVELLPTGKESELLCRRAKEHLQSVQRYQRPDHFFHDVLDDTSTFVETNLTQMLCYTIYTGVRCGWLDSGWIQIADESREAIYQKVDAYGFVQDVCGGPSFDRAGTAVEGQAFFLLMEAAYDALCQTDIRQRRPSK